MSKKNWSEEMRHEEVCKLDDKIKFLEMKENHLMSDRWREPYSKNTGIGYEYPDGEII